MVTASDFKTSLTCDRHTGHTLTQDPPEGQCGGQCILVADTEGQGPPKGQCGGQCILVVDTEG